MRRALAACLLFAVGCKKTVAPPPPTACVDATPCALEGYDGGRAIGFITAAGQVDVYTLTVPAARAQVRTLLQLALDDDAVVTPVKPVLIVETPDGGNVIGFRGPATGSGFQHLQANYLAPGAGTFPVLVRDALSRGVDPHNSYVLTGGLLDDPDRGEPDDLPPQARPLALGTTPAQQSGFIASAGDTDLCSFEVPAPGLLVHTVVAQAPSSSSPLRLRARLLARSTASPDSLEAATPLLEAHASAAGAGLTFDAQRFYPAGRYLIALDDLTGVNADERAVAQWTVSINSVPDPDPNEGATRNDTPATATVLAPGAAALQGAIASQGDRDWYQIALPATATAQLLELKLDPQLVNQDLQLNWAVGTSIAAPSAPCDASCASTLFCASSFCAFTAHASHQWAHGETAPQVVRIRHLGPAETVYVVVNDSGDLGHSTRLYAVSARLFADPDANETTAFNDTLAAATALASTTDGAGVSHVSGGGAIASWDFRDDQPQRPTGPQPLADLDWYQIPLPPKPDGGASPRPSIGMTMHWRGPSDGDYRLGLQGAVALADGGGVGCKFAFDDQFAHREGADGGYVFGVGGDPCLCLAAPNAQADSIWVRIEAAHRPGPPGPNQYSDLPYSFTLDLAPGQMLQTSCGDAGCAEVTQAASCDQILGKQ